jgi:hypothetical protein
VSAEVGVLIEYGAPPSPCTFSFLQHSVPLLSALPFSQYTNYEGTQLHVYGAERSFRYQCLFGGGEPHSMAFSVDSAEIYLTRGDEFVLQI